MIAIPIKKTLFTFGDEITFSKAPPSRILYIARALKNRGFTVEVLGGKGKDVEDLKTVQKSGSKHVARLRIRLSTYRKAIFGRYKNVIVRGTLLAFPLLPLKVLNKVIILDFHGWLFEEFYWYRERNIFNRLKVALYFFLEKAVLKCSNFIICPSKGVQNLLGEREKARSMILENGLDLNEAKKVMHGAELEKEEIFKGYSIPRSKNLIGFLGNWGGELDMEVMFEAAKIAEVNMIVIGEGPKLDEFKKKWRNLIFTGKLPRHEALKIISLCSAALVPYKEVDTFMSYYSKRKVKDYLSLGKPIIMADVKGRERFLIPNKNVLLYKTGDAEDLAAKIRRLISDRNLQQKMKQNNLMLAPQFDWTVLVQDSGLLRTIS